MNLEMTDRNEPDLFLLHVDAACYPFSAQKIKKVLKRQPVFKKGMECMRNENAINVTKEQRDEMVAIKHSFFKRAGRRTW